MNLEAAQQCYALRSKTPQVPGKILGQTAFGAKRGQLLDSGMAHTVFDKALRDQANVQRCQDRTFLLVVVVLALYLFCWGLQEVS